MNVLKVLSTPARRRASLVASFVVLAFAMTVLLWKSSVPAADASDASEPIPFSTGTLNCLK